MTNNAHIIGVVILNYNSYPDTIKLVEQLIYQTVSKFIYITIVDNASPNSSYDYLKPLEDKYDNVIVLKTAENLGYAKGNNFGLKYLDGNIKPKYVAILNNDVVLPNNCFEKLIEKYELLEKPGIIAPKQLDIKKEELLPYKMNSYLDDCLSLFYISKLFHRRNSLKFVDNTAKSAMKVEMIPGSFMFCSFKTFKVIGFFYPNTFLFAEERFIAMKTKLLDFNNYILLDQTYIHAHSKTINTVYNPVAKFRILYDSWIEFTRIYRSFPGIKIIFLRLLMSLSLVEIYLVYKIKSILIQLIR